MWNERRIFYLNVSNRTISLGNKFYCFSIKFSIELALFFKAVNEEDLHIAKTLYNRQPGVDVKARNLDGRTALLITSLWGHYDLVQWLLEEAKVMLKTFHITKTKQTETTKK